MWFNRHRVFKYLMDLQLRLDQRHLVRGTLLHTLAEYGDLRTMEMFLRINHYNFANIDPGELNTRGWTAMDLFESRRNAEKLRESLRVLELVEKARRHNEEISLASLDVRRIPVERVGNGEQYETFFDAVEFQMST